MKFIKFLQCDLVNYFCKENFFYVIIKFISPFFGMLIAYYTYKFNLYRNFENIFPRLILWLIFSRCFFIGSSRLIGESHYRKNQSLKILGFNKYHMIASAFLLASFYDAIPTAIFYFLVLTYAFQLDYQPIQMFAFIALIFLSSGLLYSFGVVTKINQTDGRKILWPVFLYLIILFTSSPVVNISVIDPHRLWFHWFAIINPLASLNLLSQAIFHNLNNLSFLYLPLASVLLWAIFCPFLWKYLIWLKW